MEIKYKNKSVEKLCTIEKEAKKFFDDIRYFKALKALINLIQQAVSLKDIVSLPFLHFHSVDFYKRNCYSLDIDGRKTKYRLIIMLLDENENIIVRDEKFYEISKNIKIIEIEEVSKHYE